jgi:serine/threonine-protein kinase
MRNPKDLHTPEGEGHMDGTALAGRALGRYFVEREIGRGATSVVYLAQDLASGRSVALKAASSASRRDSLAIDLEREGQWLVCCRAPNIVQVFDVGRCDGVSFIAMELMASTLETRKADAPMTRAEVIGLGTGMLLGLDAAHTEGILHGDIKPANVGISSDGVVKLLDFGAARPLPGSTIDELLTTAMHFGGIVGTLPYMAPEQLRGEQPDERADVYAVGAVLFELATGRPPFCELRVAPMIDAVLNAEPPRPSSLNRRIGRDTDDLLMTALAKSPSRRFQSAQEMLDALLHTEAARRAVFVTGLMRVSSDIRWFATSTAL